MPSKSLETFLVEVLNIDHYENDLDEEQEAVFHDNNEESDDCEGDVLDDCCDE